MIDRLLAFFTQTEETEEPLSVDDAAAALLIEVMMADDELDGRERTCIQQILTRRLGADAASVDECLSAAEAKQAESHDLYQFTSVVNQQYDEHQRYALVVDLWKVAFADGRLDKYEDHRIRRIVELLNLHHSHFIQAKHEADPEKPNN